MKRILLKIIFIFIVILAIGTSFWSCKKTSHNYDVVITVKMKGDTMLLVDRAKVVIEKNYVRVEDSTNVAGTMSHRFTLEAILNVHSTKDTGTMGTPSLITANSTIRLLEDRTVYRTLYLAP